MEYSEVTTLIGSFGFPIVMCLLMAWYINGTSKELTKAVNALNRTSKAMLTKLGMEEEDDDES